MILDYRSPNDTVFTVRNVLVKFGEGVASEVGYEARRLGMTRALIVTDRFIARETEMPQMVKGYLEAAGVRAEVYDGVSIEPMDSEVLKAIDFASRGDYDGFIGLGGGSSIDTAKMINLYTTHPTGDFKDYIAPPTGGGRPVPGPLKPLIAIPTTAGTGSENTPVAIVDLEREQLKVGISHPYLLPDFALLDPVLTVTLPPYYTASTGMDALLHSIEAYTCLPYYARPRPESPEARPVYVGSNPVSDLFVEKSIELIGKCLRKAYHNPNDLVARHAMLLAAHLGGAFGNAGVHIPHALAYPIAGRNHDLPHGITVCLTAPAALEFIAPAAREKLARVAQLLGEDTRDLSLEEAALLAREAVVSLMMDVDIPSGLEEVGFTLDQVDELSRAAMRIERLLSCSPRRVTLEDVKKIYTESMRNW